tara:strand:- start:174 stop:416 length:243 start_codon:yes stop_codon:yes gene_type:complete
LRIGSCDPRTLREKYRAEELVTLDDENGLGDVSQIALFWFLTAEAMADWHQSGTSYDVLELRSSVNSFTIIGVDPDFHCA